MEGLSPDLEMSLELDPYAPRAARYHVAQVDRPSPDLRDAVVLLTSELVTNAVQRCESRDAVIELRAWMPAEVVRVELSASRQCLVPPDVGDVPQYSLLLLQELADRWAFDERDGDACMWFEIDRHPHVEHAVTGARRRESSLASR